MMDENNANVDNSSQQQGGSWRPSQAPQHGAGVNFRPQQLVQYSPQKKSSFGTGHTISGMLQVVTVIGFVFGIVLMISGNSGEFNVGIVMAAGAVPVFVLVSIWNAICKIGINMSS